MTCGACGAQLEAGARFCGHCGSPMEAREAPPSPAKAVAQAVGAGGDPFVGRVLADRFRIDAKLGEGGFGAVYRGTQVRNGRSVAIKLLHPEMTRDQNLVARFRREGEVLCSLRDAHTITTYDFDQTSEGLLFIAMELLEGPTLHDVFQREGALAWPRATKILAEICSALAEAHQLGIVHRDLKPENIHLEPRPGNPEFVKVLDFGIAKVMRGDGSGGGVQQLTATGQTLGTLEYMSPEQLMGRQLDGRSDVYAVGVLTYEMVTGQLPFPDASGPAELIGAQLKSEPKAPSQVRPQAELPGEFDALILRMLAKTPDQRFADVAEVQAACETLLAGAGFGAPGSRPATGPPGTGPHGAAAFANTPQASQPAAGGSGSAANAPAAAAPAAPGSSAGAAASGAGGTTAARGGRPLWPWIALAVALAAAAGITAALFML